MEITKKYVIYRLNKTLGSDKHLSLEEVSFTQIYNSFDSEEQAIEALVLSEKKYVDYVILTQIFIR